MFKKILIACVLLAATCQTAAANVTQNGGILLVTGTTNNDAIEVYGDGRGGVTVTVNGVSDQFSGVDDTIQISASSGDDVVVVRGSFECQDTIECYCGFGDDEIYFHRIKTESNVRIHGQWGVVDNENIYEVRRSYIGGELSISSGGGSNLTLVEDCDVPGHYYHESDVAKYDTVQVENCEFGSIQYFSGFSHTWTDLTINNSKVNNASPGCCEIDLASGRDCLAVVNSEFAGTMNVDVGSGRDVIELSNVEALEMYLELGSGNDECELQSCDVAGNAEVFGDGGWDEGNHSGGSYGSFWSGGFETGNLN